MAEHTQIARYVSRAHYWRSELATAATPAEQFMHAQRWLHALVRHAGQSSRRQDVAPGSAVFTGPAEDALAEAAQAVADICQRLERRIAPGRDVWGA